MTGKKKTAPSTSKSKLLLSPQGFPKELKAAFWIALPVGMAAVLVVLWPTRFP